MDVQDWSLLLLLSVLWGGAFFFSGVAVREVPPLTMVLVRVAVAAIALLPLFWYLGYALPRTPKEWLPFAGMGLLNNVLPFGLIFAGQLYVTVGLSSIINAMTPLFAVLIMALFKEEALTTHRIIGVLLGVTGVAILKGLDGTFDPEQFLGILLVMGGALSYGFAALWGRRQLSGVAPIKSATCQLISSSIIMLIVVSIIDQPWTQTLPSTQALFSLLGLAIFGTALAYIVFFTILVRAGASNAMLVTLLIPMTAIFLGNVFLDEPIKLQEIVGALVIGLGLLVIDGRLFMKKAPGT